MSKERLMMEGKLTHLEQDARNLILKIEGFCTSIRAGLNTALTPVEELEIPLISQQMRDLEFSYVKLQGVNSQIKRIKKELGRG